MLQTEKGTQPIAPPSMTCLFLNGKFTAQRTTGVQRVAACLVEALDEQLTEFSPIWVLLCPPGGRPSALRRIQVRHVGCPGLPLFLWEQLVLPLAASPGLLVNLSGAAPWWAKRQVCTIHDAAVFDVPKAYTRLFRTWYRLSFRHMARRAAKLLTVSDFSRDRLSLALSLPKSAIAVIGCGSDHLKAVVADDSVLARHGLVGKRFLLAVGSANLTKNLAALVAAFDRAPVAPEHRLVIVGNSNRRVFSAVQIDDPDAVIRISSLADAGLKALYEKAAGLVFPSTYEGFGLPPLEAMACGCPVAVARVASLPEVCADAALYFDPASQEQITDAVVRLLGDHPAAGVRLQVAGLRQAERWRWRDAAVRLRRQVEPIAGVAVVE